VILGEGTMKDYVIGSEWDGMLVNDKDYEVLRQ
jgi:hypothetical protein